MPDHVGSLMGRAAAAACLAFTFAASAGAQSPASASPPPDFLTRYDFHLSAAALSIDDRRFSWDTHFGGDLDLVDYVCGRASIILDYEAVLGHEYRPFDPNQAYYTLEASSSLRAGGTEIAGVFHHVSRHLSDREKRFAIAWNVLGARLLRRVAVAGITIDARGGAGSIVQHGHADYSWTADLDLAIRRPLNQRVGLFAHGLGEVYGVDGTIPKRSTQQGGRAEAGVRVNGRAGAVELFAGYERRIDADPIDRLAQRWGFVGFRFVGR